jgi:NADH dehydrogenase
VILLTGATGTVGKALLPKLLEQGHQVRVLARDPSRLGRDRVEVRITLGDLAEMRDPVIRRQALRGVDTVIHLAATIRDQPAAPVEELNGLATERLLRASESSRVERFVFFSALGASQFQRTRFMRAKAVAEDAVASSPLASTVFAPSVVYDHDDPWVTLMRRMALLPVMPISGSGRAAFQPIWAGDVADCVIADLAGEADGDRRHVLAGPQTLTYGQMGRVIARSAGRERRLVKVPLNLVHLSLAATKLLAGNAAFATWEEAELLEVPMISDRGDSDVRALGVEPRRMSDVLAS